MNALEGSYLSRLADERLLRWFRGKDRKPLIVRGARQVGKTAAVRHLGASAPQFVEVNFERPADLRLARQSRDHHEFLRALWVRQNLGPPPKDTLLFLDEVQAAPELTAWLRFFAEDFPDLAVVAAGSLLEVRLRDEPQPFPVGRVSFEHLGPFRFSEFLRATGSSALAQEIVDAGRQLRPLSAALETEAWRGLREYLFVGGMPEAVAAWARRDGSGSMAVPGAIRRLHADLLAAWEEDIPKYRRQGQYELVTDAFHHAKAHFGLRFRYAQFAPDRPARSMQAAVELLHRAGVLSIIPATKSVALPMLEWDRAAPKLLPLDVGVALADLGIPYQEVEQLPVERLLSGRVAEVFVGIQLREALAEAGQRLYFWAREKPASAEVDYLVPGGSVPVPVEVKSGSAGKLRSLHQFLAARQREQRNNQVFAAATGGLELPCIRLHAGPFADERHHARLPSGDGIDLRLLSLPLYAADVLLQLLPEIRS